jgi:hypothetical protein
LAADPEGQPSRNRQREEQHHRNLAKVGAEGRVNVPDANATAD